MFDFNDTDPAFGSIVLLIPPKKMQPDMEFGISYHHLKGSNWTCLWMMVIILIGGLHRRWVKSLYLWEGVQLMHYKSNKD